MVVKSGLQSPPLEEVPRRGGGEGAKKTYSYCDTPSHSILGVIAEKNVLNVAKLRLRVFFLLLLAGQKPETPRYEISLFAPLVKFVRGLISSIGRVIQSALVLLWTVEASWFSGLYRRTGLGI